MIQTSVKLLFCPIRGFIKLLILCSILNIIPTYNIYADNTPAANPTEDQGPKDTAIKTLVDTLQRLNCQTQGLGKMLVRTEFSHTCIQVPLLTLAVANILSPGLYLDTMLRLKINDPELFDSTNPKWKGGETQRPDGKWQNDFPGGQCARNNKIPFNDNNPTLTFAICNNKRLLDFNGRAIAKSVLALIKAAVTNTEPWEDILHTWRDSKIEYHDIRDIKDGETFFMVDIPPGLPVVWLKGRHFKDTMCITVKGITWDDLPVGCKYISEPDPNSIYQSFLNPGGSTPKGDRKDPKDPMAIVECGLTSSSCYQRAYNNSKTAIVITAPLIECFKEMTARLLLSREVCTFDDVNNIVNSSTRDSSMFFQFQRKMYRTVTALLTIYVMFFGFKLIISGDIPPKKDIINFILKMLFVTYFSVGININPAGSNNDYGRLDGMIQWAFPLLLGGIDTLAGWVMNASPSKLCQFNGPDLIYDAKLAYMPLWDALDCRVSHYLGLDMLSTLLVESSAHGFDPFSFPAPPYVYLLIPAIISGNMTLISLALAYPLLVISVGAFMINATVMCMISIVILGILAPIFVPMFLFNYTRSYFEAWVKLLISFLLQPMVVTTFMIVMFSVYDFGFYGHCKYTNKIIENSIEDALTGSSSPRKVKIFFIDNDWSKYHDDEIKSCKNSLGYILNNPLTTILDLGKSTVEQGMQDRKTVKEMVKEKPGTISTEQYMNKFSFLKGIQMDPGMFFNAPKIIFEKIKDIVLALITACFTLYLMYHFSAQLANFAADMTEGVALNNVTINPQAIFKAGMAAAAAAKGMMPGDQVAGGRQGPKDTQASSGGSGPRDSAASAAKPTGGKPDDRSSVSPTETGGGGVRSSIKSMLSSLPKDQLASPQEKEQARKEASAGKEEPAKTEEQIKEEERVRKEKEEQARKEKEEQIRKEKEEQARKEEQIQKEEQAKKEEPGQSPTPDKIQAEISQQTSGTIEEIVRKVKEAQTKKEARDAQKARLKRENTNSKKDGNNENS
ncbi:type IV secretion system protein [Candidatus Tisiphia endosymbiont of Nemotelus uliginosus]|uniref:type IV secretion system protein n=1 Tax=Candidatus Tisiphia endosymbiont of Nemotelus uliginosus TaxID=3077926 RepID=UPI0035C932C1